MWYITKSEITRRSCYFSSLPYSSLPTFLFLFQLSFNTRRSVSRRQAINLSYFLIKPISQLWQMNSGLKYVIWNHNISFSRKHGTGRGKVQKKGKKLTNVSFMYVCLAENGEMLVFFFLFSPNNSLIDNSLSE